MAHQVFTVKGAVSEGTVLIEGMGDRFFYGTISITLFDSADYDTAVLAGAGTVAFTGSEDGFNFGDINEGTVDATLGNYARPNFAALVRTVKAVFTGVTVGTHYEIRVARWTE